MTNPRTQKSPAGTGLFQNDEAGGFADNSSAAVVPVQGGVP